MRSASTPNRPRTAGRLLALLLAVPAGPAVAQDSVPSGPAAGPAAPVRQTLPCTVTRIVDGDTIECAEHGRIRLIGMDTPEWDQDPFGRMATEALEALVPVGAQIELEPDVEARDRYDRVLAYLWHDGVMLNWALVRQGYAVLLTYPPNVQYVDWFVDAQRMAREEQRGLWAVNGFECEPRAHRRGDC